MNLNRRTIFIAFNIIFLVAIFNFIINTVSASREISQLRKNEKIVLNNIKDLEIKREQKKIELRSLTDDKTIEKIARDKLNMKKKGETVYRFVNE